MTRGRINVKTRAMKEGRKRKVKRMNKNRNDRMIEFSLPVSSPHARILLSARAHVGCGATRMLNACSCSHAEQTLMKKHRIIRILGDK
jgi:hypothetical protein